MPEPMYHIEPLAQGDLFDVPGIKGGSARTGVKPSGHPDLALIVADAPMSCAAMFTTNRCAAAPVQLGRETLEAQAEIKSIVVNSGNANALTGQRGMDDARVMVRALEESCGGPGLVLSTGIIGVPLPIEQILKGIRETSQQLSQRDHHVPEAILTTDTCTKTAAVQIIGSTPEERWTIGGIAKGSGMIHPNMATMLAVMATDLPLPADQLKAALQVAVDQSFHEISVDGDTSTNDTVVAMAAQPTSAAPVDDSLYQAFVKALGLVSSALSDAIVNDGEGASRWMCLKITGAASPEDAKQVAAAIACSPLVKTALAGGNPNWGRILSAAGNAGVPLLPERLTLQLGDHVVFQSGAPMADNTGSALDEAFSAKRVVVHLDLGMGGHTGRMTTIDLTHQYIEINAEYTT